MKGFLDFIRRQGVVGLAVGFILGGAVSKFVSSIVTDLINPIIGIALGPIGDLKNVVIPVLGAKIAIGNFLSIAIDFAIISAVVYWGVKKLRLDRLDVPKDAPQAAPQSAPKA